MQILSISCRRETEIYKNVQLRSHVLIEQQLRTYVLGKSFSCTLSRADARGYDGFSGGLDAACLVAK
jgi:hypothetical protein